MKPHWKQDGNIIYQGHAPEILKNLELESVHCVVTSPPYWGLRDYGLPPMIWDVRDIRKSCLHKWGDQNTIRKYGRHGDNAQCGNTKNDAMDAVLNQGQFCQLCGAWRGSLGLEPTPELYIKHIVEIFREVKRVLRKDGTVWLNLGDSYFGGKSTGSQPKDANGVENARQTKNTLKVCQYCRKEFIGYPTQRFCSDACGGVDNTPRSIKFGMKPKDLCGIPWRVALALQADGWWLRQDIIWSKPNPMPESVTDRCTKSHEYMFLLTKSGKYFFDGEAIKVPAAESTHDRGPVDFGGEKGRNYTPEKSDPNYRGGNEQWGRTYHYNGGTVNKRSVWQIATHPMPDAHFATFPPKLVEPCILVGTSEKGCCPECGAPWERVLSNPSGGTTGKSWQDHSDDMGKGNAKKQTGMEFKTYNSAKTIGWKPTCECYGTEPFPEYPKRKTVDMPEKTLTGWQRGPGSHDKIPQGNYSGAIKRDEADEDYEIRIAPIRKERLRLLKLWKPLKTIPCIVADIFFGSGTVGTVAHKHGRNFTGIELSKAYLDDIAIPRIKKETAQMKMF